MANEPKEFRVKEVAFLRGSPNLHQLGVSELPEIALIGRSNAGKSSLINRLTNRKGLARTSSTPGRTQEINLFSLSILTPEDTAMPLVLADLPGFGFSKFAQSKRAEMSRLIVDYIQEREALKTVCILSDCRRIPGEDERAVQKLAFAADRSVMVILTKCDKLSKNELKKQSALVAKAYHLEASDILFTGTGFPPSAVWQRILTSGSF